MLESMQRVLWYVQSYEKLFAQRQLAEFGEKQKKEFAEKRRELDKSKLRVREIDGIIQKLYEDNAMGKISDERFATMSMSLENEQSGLKDRIPALEDELENAKVKTEGLQRFIDKAKRVTRLEALTSELVHEFIEKIVVSAPEYKDGKRYQKIAIHYNGVGIIREPTAEEMEEYFQEHISKKSFLKAKNGIAYGYTAFTQQYLIKIQSRLGAPSLRKVPQKNPVFFIKIPVPDIPSDVYTWPKARHRLVYASDPGDIPVLPV